MNTPIYLGKNFLHANAASAEGQFVTLAGESFYRITHYDRLRPFFMSLVGSSDQWLFISSNGALTAGRRDPDLALFPYYTEDKIHDSAEITGSKTVLLIQQRGRTCLWEPFSDRFRGLWRVQRNLYKGCWANQLVFEEVNEDLRLTFRYGWYFSQRFGFVRKASICNLGRRPIALHLLDGIQNLMPCGVGSQFQLEKSNLLDAYRKSELVPETGLGLFRLSSIPVDRPVPAEALRTTTVWSTGLTPSLILLSSAQIERFGQGLPLQPEPEVRAARGAYFLAARMTIIPGRPRHWAVVAEVAQGASEIAALNRMLTGNRATDRARRQRLLEQDLERGAEELKRLVGSADGLHQTAEPLANARQFSNVLFNVMRGGIFIDGYQTDPADLRQFIHRANRDVGARHGAFFQSLARLSRHAAQTKPAANAPGTVHYGNLLGSAAATGDPQLDRLCREYLPLTFSRRHGDPSRPWNRFSLAATPVDGKRKIHYEGNWRDIFQNWEPLALSFPGYTASMVSKFVNASTADGYNPYRLTHEGIDWEVPNPQDPWSHIGYWGDHQIIYLLKLLEILERHEPATLRQFLTREIFSYANVPYRLKPYAQMLQNPKETVDFAPEIEALVRRRVQMIGSDGKLVWNPAGAVYLVNLTEKLLVPWLTKLSNFVPGAGIWLNTQRPEWNDANNALVGNGVSMVTLFYLRRYLAFCQAILRASEHDSISLSEEVADFFLNLAQVLERDLPWLAGRTKEYSDSLRNPAGRRIDRSSAGAEVRPMDTPGRFIPSDFTDRERRRILDHLGQAGSEYRQRIYARGFSGRKKQIKVRQFLDFSDRALAFIDHTIGCNRRRDGLFHAYNLIVLGHRREISVRRLYEMLEGQVAALSSGCLSASDSLELLRSLKRSPMYRADQRSYLLYPDRPLPRFLERNNIPRVQIAKSKLLRELVKAGHRGLVEPDGNGRVHFAGSITNAADVRRVLDELAATSWRGLVKLEAPMVLGLFERLFDHQSFTGRSGTFFGYEGLGCIYWHMVSKLLLAAQETYFRAANAGAPRALLVALANCYYDIREGLGDRKSPQEYGAFPMDPYSHTPGDGGARQPGLTGQVKEDILCRLGELGVFVEAGQIGFRPLLLRRREFLPAHSEFAYYDQAGDRRRISLPPRSLAFTYCQVPILYQLAVRNQLSVFFREQPAVRTLELRLDAATSRSIFARNGSVSRIIVRLNLEGFNHNGPA